MSDPKNNTCVSAQFDPANVYYELLLAHMYHCRALPPKDHAATSRKRPQQHSFIPWYLGTTTPLSGVLGDREIREYGARRLHAHTYKSRVSVDRNEQATLRPLSSPASFTLPRSRLYRMDYQRSEEPWVIGNDL